MSGEFTFGISREDFVSAYWFYTRWLWLWRRMAIALAITTLVYAAMMIALDGFYALSQPAELLGYFKYAAIYALFIGVLLVGVTFVTLPRRLKRLYDDLKVAGRETRFEFDGTGLRTSNRDGTGNFEWNRFKHSIENDRFLMLVLSRWSFIIIPKTLVASAVLSKLRAAAEAGGVVRR